MPIRLDELEGRSTPKPQVQGTIPPSIPVARPYISSIPFGRGGRITIPPPSDVLQQRFSQKQAEQGLQEDSATRRQLLKKAADQKLQLEQAIGLFDKIFQESELDIPVIENPEGTLPFQRIGRTVGRELGFREKQRGTINSLQARATPALKALGEVGVLTDQDIQRMLRGGFPADDDTAISRQAKRTGMISDLQRKLDQVNATLGGDFTSTLTPDEEDIVDRLLNP